MVFVSIEIVFLQCFILIAVLLLQFCMYESVLRSVNSSILSSKK